MMKICLQRRVLMIKVHDQNTVTECRFVIDEQSETGYGRAALCNEKSSIDTEDTMCIKQNVISTLISSNRVAYVDKSGTDTNVMIPLESPNREALDCIKKVPLGHWW